MCRGCGRTFTFRGLNAHHSKRNAAEACQGRQAEAAVSISVNARNYRVTVQDSESRAAGESSMHDQARGPASDSDSEGDAGPGPANSDIGPGESCKTHVTNK